MEELLKKIVCKFSNIEENLISDDTVIDRTVFRNSIILHRMYAKIAEQGYEIGDYIGIKTFGELKSRIEMKSTRKVIEGIEHTTIVVQQKKTNNNAPIPAANSIGIDLQQISMLPKTMDFRSDSFYTQNFSTDEISHCILQADPYNSFAGMFAAKEALVKANQELYSKQFNEIIVTHDERGKPCFPGAILSISHGDEYAIAVAAFVNSQHFELTEQPTVSDNSKSRGSITLMLAVTSLILSIIAVCKVFNIL